MARLLLVVVVLNLPTATNRLGARALRLNEYWELLPTIPRIVLSNAGLTSALLCIKLSSQVVGPVWIILLRLLIMIDVSESTDSISRAELLRLLVGLLLLRWWCVS